MPFDPKTFLSVSKEISGNTEAHYRSIANRAYYGAFGHIRNKLNLFIDAGSVHKEVIKTLVNSTSVKEKKIGKRLETLFKLRKRADYDHSEEIKLHIIKDCVKEAEDIVDLFNKPEER